MAAWRPLEGLKRSYWVTVPPSAFETIICPERWAFRRHLAEQYRERRLAWRLGANCLPHDGQAHCLVTVSVIGIDGRYVADDVSGSWTTTPNFWSIARTGTRFNRPTCMMRMSPRSAAAYEPFRESPKQRLPASGTLIVSGCSIMTPTMRFDYF